MMNRLKNYDFLLIVLPLLLAGFGIVMIYSASMVSAVMNGLESTYYVVRQAQWFIIGLLAFGLGLVIPYQRYQKLVIPLIGISFISLLLVSFFGKTEFNATRTVMIFGLNIQPSEFVKLIIIIYLASVYSKKQAYINNF